MAVLYLVFVYQRNVRKQRVLRDDKLNKTLWTIKFIQSTHTQPYARAHTHTTYRGHTRTDNKHKARVTTGVPPWNGQWQNATVGFNRFKGAQSHSYPIIIPPDVQCKQALSPSDYSATLVMANAVVKCM